RVFLRSTATTDEVACYDDIVLPAPPEVRDNCGNILTPSDPVEGEVPECAGTVTYTWTYTDCAGHTQDYVHTVTITPEDGRAPTATTAEVACDDRIVLPAPPELRDNC